MLQVLEFFHFACTSEDINNLAHGLMLRDAVNLVMLPIMDELIYVMCDMATKTSNISMLSRTHGQVNGLPLVKEIELSMVYAIKIC